MPFVTVQPTGKPPISSASRQNPARNRIGAVDDDRARFTRLVLPHLGDAYSLARSITGRGPDAEDVVQDACVRAFRAIGSVRDETARSWLLTIVRNTAYTWLRKNRPAAEFAVDDLEAIESAHAPPRGPEGDAQEAALIAKVDATQLAAAIAALPSHHRETITLRDIQGLSYLEISAVTEVPIGTVMSRLARARAKLIASMTRGDAAEPGYVAETAGGGRSPQDEGPLQNDGRLREIRRRDHGRT
jgi:RNA polymerase sigma factor (sigma-70 family)